MREPVTVGARHFSDEAAKRYPDLTLTLKHGAIRSVLETFKLAEVVTRIQVPLQRHVIRRLEQHCAEVTRRTGLVYPDRLEGRRVFDDEVGEVSFTLNDIDQAIFNDLLFRWVPGNKRRYIPNDEFIYDVLGVFRDHICAHGGYDHSRSVDNLFHLHPESPVMQAYLAAAGRRLLTEPKGFFTTPSDDEEGDPRWPARLARILPKWCFGSAFRKGPRPPARSA